MMQQIMQVDMTITRSTPTPRLEITTPAVRNPGITVPGGVSSGGREIRKKVRLLGYSYSCVAALQVCWYMVIQRIQN